MLKIITEYMIVQAAIQALVDKHQYTVLRCMTDSLKRCLIIQGEVIKNRSYCCLFSLKASAGSILAFPQKRCT